MFDNETKQLEEPKGIPFFSIKTGETHWCKLEPTISAYINSSDMGINASRDQDWGWRLGADWVKRVKAFKRNRQEMSILTAKNQGQKPSTVQILYYLYGEELAAFYESQEEFENPYEEEYQDSLAGRGVVVNGEGKKIPAALADFLAEDDDDDDIADLIDDVIEEDEPATTSEPTTPPATSETAKTLETKPADVKEAQKPKQK